MELYLYLNIHDTQIDFKKSLIEARESGQLQEILKSSWELSSTPIVDNIDYEEIESKNQRKETGENVNTSIQFSK